MISTFIVRNKKSERWQKMNATWRSRDSAPTGIGNCSSLRTVQVSARIPSEEQNHSSATRTPRGCVHISHWSLSILLSGQCRGCQGRNFKQLQAWRYGAKWVLPSYMLAELRIGLWSFTCNPSSYLESEITRAPKRPRRVASLLLRAPAVFGPHPRIWMVYLSAHETTQSIDWIALQMWRSSGFCCKDGECCTCKKLGAI